MGGGLSLEYLRQGKDESIGEEDVTCRYVVCSLINVERRVWWWSIGMVGVYIGERRRN